MKIEIFLKKSWRYYFYSLLSNISLEHWFRMEILYTDNGPWSVDLVEITDFRLIEIYDHETGKPKEVFLVVHGGQIYILPNTLQNQIAYEKWRGLRSTNKLKR